MSVGGRFRNQQHEQQVDRGAIDGVEIDRGIQVQQGADRPIAAFEPAMRNGNAIAKTGRAQFFTGDQAFEHILHRQLGNFPADQVGNLF
ncbi:hypothetical protein D9M71_817750 [compost metagenome]